MQSEFLTKQGEIIMTLADHFLQVTPGDRLPSVSDYCALLNAGSGTVQSALKLLIDSGAIELESHGHQGTFVVSVDRAQLWKTSEHSVFFASMPLPYTTRLQGLATALYEQFEAVGIPFSLSYARGGRMRVDRLLLGHAQFVVCSRQSAKIATSEHSELMIALEFGPQSYLDGSMYVFSEPGHETIENGMRVGVDESSYEHTSLMELACEGLDCEFVPLAYTEIFTKLRQGVIDVTIWSLDEINEKYPDLPMAPTSTHSGLRRTMADCDDAVVLTRDEDAYIRPLLRDIINIPKLRQVQEEVRLGRKMPSY